MLRVRMRVRILFFWAKICFTCIHSLVSATGETRAAPHFRNHRGTTAVLPLVIPPQRRRRHRHRPRHRHQALPPRQA